MTHSNKGKKSNNSMRATVPGFATAKVLGTSRDGSKAYDARIHCTCDSPEALKAIKQVFQLNENLVDGSIKDRGDFSSVTFDFKVDVIGLLEPEHHTRSVVCDLIAAIGRIGERFVAAAPVVTKSPERPTRGRRTSRR